MCVTCNVTSDIFCVGRSTFKVPFKGVQLKPNHEANSGLKACKACKLVKYCNVDCQVAHRSKHKKACREKAAELFDMKLFEQPPEREDCPVCMLPMQYDDQGLIFMTCCGKMICDGCFFMMCGSTTRRRCPFCNTFGPQDREETVKRLLERVEKYNDAGAMNDLATFYTKGEFGFPLDVPRGIALYQRAADLGSALAHFNLGKAYRLGKAGQHVDQKKAIHHYQTAAIMGCMNARFDLGIVEAKNGNHYRALRHFTISAKCGHDWSLKFVKEGFMKGLTTKDDFEITLRCHQASQDEAKSEQRDRAKVARQMQREG